MSSGVAFVPFATYIDPTFWSEVNKRKVNVWKLEAVERKVVASYSLRKGLLNDESNMLRKVLYYKLIYR